MPTTTIEARVAADRAAGVTRWWVMLCTRGQPGDVHALLLTATPTDIQHALALERAAGTLTDDAVEVGVTACVLPAAPAVRDLIDRLPLDTPLVGWASSSGETYGLSRAEQAAIAVSVRRALQ